jgi:predicted membrane channel-forming protein YqfA (hemolysin III family)
MFADTLFAAERLHLVRLLIWGAISIVAGTILLLLTSSSRLRPQLLRSFAQQCILWGALELALSAIRFATLHLRDLSGASELERFGWMQLGIYIGLAACGIAIATTGWRTARSLRTAGAGLGIFLQGVALLVMQLFFVAQISR